MNALSIIALDLPEVEFAKHNPLVVIGFALIGFQAVLYFHMLLKLDKVGERLYRLGANWKIPGLYSREARRRGWPVWPNYVLWVALGLGIALLALGMFRLND